MKDTSQQQAQEEEAKKYDRGQKKPLRIQLTPHKKLLPNTIATAIVTKFRVLPGEDVSQVTNPKLCNLLECFLFE
jgi:hypothetical protein